MSVFATLELSVCSCACVCVYVCVFSVCVCVCAFPQAFQFYAYHCKDFTKSKVGNRFVAASQTALCVSCAHNARNVFDLRSTLSCNHCSNE